jgi:hypothetical protein
MRLVLLHPIKLKNNKRYSKNQLTMKNLTHLFFILISLISLSTYAQTNNKTLNYQAVILDPKAIDIPGASIVGQPLNNGKVCLRFSLLNAQGGLDYEETQQVTTDEYGLVNVAIGTGSQAQASNSTSIYKSFESIVWNANVKSLKVSVSYDGCSSFKQVSTQIFNYTPYALYAEAVDYKNVREAPTKLSQFSNDAGFLIPKDLDPLKSDIQTNSSKIEAASKSIADNKQSSDAAFLVVNQSITSLDKQVAQNTGSITTINTKITDQQNQINDNRNQIIATNNNLNTQIGGLQGQLNTTNSTVSNLSGVAEMQSNKSTAINLGGANPSDQAYPSQKAAKAYVDQVVSQIATSGVPDATTLAAGKVQLAGDLGGTATSPTVPALAGKENSSNKSTATDLGAGNPSDQLYPSQKATKAYVDNSIYAAVGSGVPDATTNAAGKVKLAGDLAGTAASPSVPGLLLKEDVSNKSNAALGTSTTIYPTQNAVKTYVDSQVASATIVDADASTRGKIQLAGDLAGTATAPTVPGLLLKEDVSNKSDGALGTSTTLYPTQNAVKTYVDAQVASGAPDATSLAKGKIALSGDLAGTNSSASAPVISDNAITSGKIANLAVIDAKIAGVAGSKVSGNITGNADNVTGTVAVANGGTGATTLTLNNVLLGNGASALQVVAPGASGNVLTSNGTTWISSAPANSVSGSAATLTTARTIYGNSFDGSANVTGVIASNFGGTGNGFTKFTGASGSEKTYTLPNADAVILTNQTAVSINQGGTGATNKTAAFDALSPMTSPGDIIYGTSGGSGSRLAKGLDNQVLTIVNGLPAWNTSSGVSLPQDANEESLSTLSQTSFTLLHNPISTSKVKMYINGIRISNSAYSISGTTVTYNAVNNGAYDLALNDRIQFDYQY